jgi:hypothetical protein
LPEPSTKIIGAPDMYIESGSTINLTCIVYNSPEPPAFIFWYHNNGVSRIFNFQFKISKKMQKNKKKVKNDKNKERKGKFVSKDCRKA